jgi:hypothetical protein
MLRWREKCGDMAVSSLEIAAWMHLGPALLEKRAERTRRKTGLRDGKRLRRHRNPLKCSFCALARVEERSNVEDGVEKRHCPC